MIPFDDEVKWILGRPNFTFMHIAEIMRRAGKDIPRKAEDEQAHGIYWMLEMYEKHGANWRDEAEKWLKDNHPQTNSGLQKS